MAKTYEQTKEQCQATIDKLDNVCPECGKKEIKPLETVDNAGSPTYWSFCNHGKGDWGILTSGIPEEIYKMAYKLVLDGERYYSHLDRPGKTKEAKEYWMRSQISGLCGLLNRINYLKKNKPRQTKKEFFKYL